jgi:molecular chaperone GrpE (heat shock protein)
MYLPADSAHFAILQCFSAFLSPIAQTRVSALMQSEDMAKIPINDPDHWRRRAEETRTVAAEISDFQVKRKMLRIAEDYEELARRAEKRLAAKKKGN